MTRIHQITSAQFKPNLMSMIIEREDIPAEKSVVGETCDEDAVGELKDSGEEEEEKEGIDELDSWRGGGGVVVK